MNETAPGKSKKWLAIPAGIAVVGILCFILLPTIMSSQWGKERVLGMAAPHIPGSVEVDNWSLSWLGEQEVNGLSYVDVEAGVELNSARLAVSRSLIALLMNSGDIGTVRVVQPEMILSLPEPVIAKTDSTTPLASPKGQQSNSDGPKPEKSTSPEQGPLVLPELIGSLVIENGSLALQRGKEETRELLANDINVEVAIDALPGDITYSLDLNSADNSGTITGKGVVTAREAQASIDSFQPTGELSIENWDISRLLEIAAVYGDAPEGGGILNSELSFDGSSQGQIKADGTIKLNNFELYGGPLGNDHPVVEKSTVSFALSTDLRSVEVRSLVLDSPLARGGLTADMSGSGAQQLTADFTLDLPVVAEQLPHSLNLKEGLQITAGTLSIKGDMQGVQGRKKFDAGGKVDGLAGLRDDKQIELSEPFTFKLTGDYGSTGLNLEQFTLHSSFINGEGQGSLDDMQLSIQADLGAALGEISKFVALDEYSGRGSLVLSLNAQRKDETKVKLTANLDSEKLILKKGQTVIIPNRPIKVETVSHLLLNREFKFTGAADTNLAYQFWFGEGKVEAKSYDAASGQLSGLTLDGRTDLNRLSVLLKGLDALPDEFSLEGSQRMRLAVDYSPLGITISSLNGEVDNFVFKQENKAYHDKRLVIETKGHADLEKREASLAPVHIESSTGEVSFDKFIVGDWSIPTKTLTSKGEARFSLGTFIAAANEWIQLPEDISTDADVSLNLISEGGSGSAQSFSLKAELDNFDLKRADHQPFAGDTASLQVTGASQNDADRLTIDQLSITSPLVNFDTSGFVGTAEDKDTEVSFTGDLAMDLDRLASFIRAFTDMDLEMAGKSERPFELQIKANPEQKEQWWLHTDFTGAFQADLIKLMGVELRSLDVPVTLSKGEAWAEIEGSANGGSLHLQPRLDLASSPAVVTLPDNSLVIDQMQLTSEMANKLLGRIHPLFMGATQMSGAVSLQLDNFWYPLGKENLNDLKFAGFLDLHDTKIDSSMLLGSLLGVLKVDEAELDLSDRQILFVCESGRITTNPLNTDLSDTTLIMSGSLGLDGTIDYLVQAEVTENLVGGDLYKYLEDTTINIPIGGTVSDPDISGKTVQRAMTDLIRQAGQKKLQESAGSLLKKLF